jgi:hypothetical protein
MKVPFYSNSFASDLTLKKPVKVKKSKNSFEAGTHDK